MRIALSALALMSVSSCSPKPTLSPEDKARTELAKLMPRLNGTIDVGNSLAESITGDLVSSIRSEMQNASDAHHEVQMSHYVANLDNYSYTPSGVVARLELENEMKRDKAASLTKEISVLAAASPLESLLTKMKDDQAVALAGGKEVALRDRLTRVALLSSRMIDALKKLKQRSPDTKRVSQKMLEADAFAQRLNVDLEHFNRIQIILHQAQIALPTEAGGMIK